MNGTLVKLGPHEEEEQVWRLTAEPLLIGREVAGPRVIRFPSGAAQVSKRHAVIRKGFFGYVLEDLGSANGTLVNGQKVKRRTLRHRDEIRIGDIRLRVHLEEKRASMASVRMIRGLSKGTTWTLENSLVVGRDPSSQIRVPDTDASVSKRHAAFQKRGGKFYVGDLGSKNGTLVNGRRVQDQVLADGDRIETGDVAFRIEIRAARNKGIGGLFRLFGGG